MINPDNIPQITKESIDAYVEHGLPLGGFLSAFLSNDLMGALGKADQYNLKAFPEIGSYIYNRIPSTAWGSPEKVNAWLERKAEERRNG